MRSQGELVDCAFLSGSMRALGWFRHPRKGQHLPKTATREFNADPGRVARAERWSRSTTTSDWFGLVASYPLKEEIIGLGGAGRTLTVLSSEAFPAP